MNTEDKKKNSQGMDGDPAGAGNLDKVRDILFGSQVRETDKRFSRLEERIVRESSDLREEIRKKFDTLEAYIKKEVESLTDRLKSEQSERADATREVSKELKELTKTVEKKMGQLDEQISKNQRQLRDQLLEQSKNFDGEIRRSYEELTAMLGQAVHELRSEKTDRAALADLFTELAMRLKDEFQIPDNA